MSKKHIWDTKKNVITFLKGFFTLCFLLFIASFFTPIHPHLPWENFPGFYAVYGFVACVILVLISKYVLRPIVQRKEDFYD